MGVSVTDHERRLAHVIEEFQDAYQARDVERMLGYFADDAEVTLAPGTFRGKDAIRKVLAWDARLSPTAKIRQRGAGLVASGDTVLSERVISLTYEGIPYDERAATVYEFDDADRIRRMHSYYDKLDLMDQISSRMPGVRGFVFRRLIGYLVAAGKKGLDTSST